MATTYTYGVSTRDIVERYLTFFEERNHLRLPGSPLVVPRSNTSFIIAGMQPLLPYLRGDELPPSPKLTALQRCLRSDDADAVGTNARKLTCFHMLGNWSIGDYNRGEAVALALDLLDTFGVARERLWVTSFSGDEDLGLPRDEVVIDEWVRCGIARDRVVPLGMEDNFWSTGGPGPCGPCSEIFVDFGPSRGCGRPECRPGCACNRFLEIWNLVFIEYEQHMDGSYTPLPMRSVDTGMGLERIAAVLQNVPTVFDTDVFAPALQRLDTLAPVQTVTPQIQRARQLIVDHTRAALFAGIAGVTPDRDGRGSVVRRLIRRASRYGRILGLERPFLGELVLPIIQGHEGLLTQAEQEQFEHNIMQTLTNEEHLFAGALTRGLREVERLQPQSDGHISGADLFRLHAERGFPADLAAEMLEERGLTVDWMSYERAVEAHRHVSGASAKRLFHLER